MRFLWVLVALLSLFALVSTGERANTGVGCLIAAFVPALHFKSGRAKLIGVGILLLAIPAILHFGGDKLAGLLSFDFANLNSSDTMRAAHWSVAWDSWKTAPLFGHGLGTYSDLAVQHPVHGDFLRTPVRHGQFAAHSYPLHTLATQGLFGLACVCWCAAAILMSFVRAFKARPQAATYGIFACLIFAGTSLTDTPMYQSVRLAAFTLLAGFSYGLIVADQNKMLGSKQMTPPKEGVL
jgi:O-antigen ligase